MDSAREWAGKLTRGNPLSCIHEYSGPIQDDIFNFADQFARYRGESQAAKIAEADATAKGERCAELEKELLNSWHQLEYIERQGCPCGARPESLNTHPHVDGCGIEQLLRAARALLKPKGKAE